MAASTLRTKSAVVLIVFVMTTGAGFRDAGYFIRRFFMAVIASDVFMLSLQLKVCFVVIKIPDFPVPRVMACFTVDSQAAFMSVLFFMARPAIRFCIPECGGNVALFAFHRDMLSG